MNLCIILGFHFIPTLLNQEIKLKISFQRETCKPVGDKVIIILFPNPFIFLLGIAFLLF